jgi:hypothetical protein
MVKKQSLDEYLQHYPRICAAIIAYSLGYATPRCAANILKDAHEGRQNWCEWIYSCYGCDPRPAVQHAIRSRHSLQGYMADYRQALAIVRRATNDGEHPLFASWF